MDGSAKPPECCLKLMSQSTLCVESADFRYALTFAALRLLIASCQACNAFPAAVFGMPDCPPQPGAVSRSRNVKADLSTDGLRPHCHIVAKRNKLDFQSMRSTFIEEPLNAALREKEAWRARHPLRLCEQSDDQRWATQQPARRGCVLLEN
jgi:hypothetical protein